MTALIVTALENLPAIIALGEEGYHFITALRTAAQQSGEWTEQNKADFQAKLASEAIDPAWLTDAAREEVSVTTPEPASF